MKKLSQHKQIHFYRFVLKQPVPASSVASSDGYEDKKLPVLLIQKLLSKAIQPSPIRAVFSKREMESAALDVSQYLSSAAAAKRINLEGNSGRSSAPRSAPQKVIR